MTFYLKNNLDDLILFFICVGLFALFTEHVTTFKTISGISLYLLLFYKHIILKQNIFCKLYKKILVFISFFFLSLFLSAIFSEMPMYSLKWIKKSYWVSVAIGLAIISICYKKELFKALIITFVVIFIWNNYYFYLKAIEHCKIWDIFSPKFTADRNYTSLLPMLFPFVLTSMLVYKNFVIRAIIVLNILFTFLLLFTIGSRGAFVSIFVEIILWLIFVTIMFFKIQKKTVIYLALVFCSIIGFVVYKYHNHPMVKSAIKRGISLNGRDVIIKDRFPVIFKERPILGIGYGRLLYFNFLDKHNVPKRFGHYDPKEKRFIYHSDEGIFIQTIIRQGIVGGIIFILLFYFILKNIYLHVKKQRDLFLKAFYFSLFCVFIGHYFVRGLVETLSLTHFIIFAFLSAISFTELKNKNETCHNLS